LKLVSTSGTGRKASQFTDFRMYRLVEVEVAALYFVFGKEP
ncbi:hypothetical protein T06_9937, partial [Trichinella sp. T6]